MRPDVRRPYSAGSAPVISDRLPTKAVSSTWLKPETPSGRMMPLILYCTLACSLRTWIWPLATESWVTPGACRSTLPNGALVPSGIASNASRFKEKELVPIWVRRLSRALSSAWVSAPSGPSCGDPAAALDAVDVFAAAAVIGGAEPLALGAFSAGAFFSCSSITVTGGSCSGFPASLCCGAWGGGGPFEGAAASCAQTGIVCKNTMRGSTKGASERMRILVQ